MNRLACLLFAATAVAAPSARAAAPPGSLTLDDALRAAAAKGPAAAALAARREASEAAAAKGRRFPNPEASLRVENWRRGSETRPFDSATDLDVVAELTQPLPLFGSFSGRRAAAAAVAREAGAAEREGREALLIETARLKPEELRVGKDVTSLA